MAMIRTNSSLGDMRRANSNSTQNLRRLSLSSTEGVEKSPLQKSVVTMLRAPTYEYLMGTLITVNIFVIVVEIDRSVGDEKTSSGLPHWTDIFGWTVLLIFASELVLRLFAFRCSFWQDSWNIFDFIVVITDITFTVIALLAGKIFPVTILRVFRLAKLARVSKVLQVFPELRMLVSSLARSFSAIFWGSILLCLMLLVWAMLAVVLIHPLNQHIDYDGCERCPRAYNSVMSSCLTFWQQIVAGDSWGQSTIPLLEKHPLTYLFFIPLFSCIGLAVLNLMIGVVVTVAQQAKDDLREAEDIQSSMVKLENQTSLLKLCKQLDQDGDGMLSREEFWEGFQKPGEFHDAMMALGLTIDEFDVLWAQIDRNNTGTVSYKRLVGRLYRLGDHDWLFTLAYLKHHITLLKQMLLDQMEDNEAGQTKVEGKFRSLEEKGATLLERQERLLERLQVTSCDVNEEEQALENGVAIREGDTKMPNATKEGGIKAHDADKKLQDLQNHASRQANTDGLQGVISASLPLLDETPLWVGKICHEFEVLRVELKDLSEDMKHVLNSKVSPLPATEGNTVSEAKLDLMVVPDKTSSWDFLPKCCAQHDSDYQLQPSVRAFEGLSL